MKRVLMATGQNNINTAINYIDGYELAGVADSKDEVLNCVKQYRPEIMIIGDGLRGQSPLLMTMMQAKIENPQVRIVYLSAIAIYETDKLKNLSPLISAGIFDIIYGRELSIDSLREILDKPMTKDSQEIQKIMNLVIRDEKKNEEVQEISFASSDDIIFDLNEDGSYRNVATVSSIKPGTGKSFMSVNVAVAIAKYGKKINGKPPRVGLVEADLQNLSIGTILQIEDNKKNLKTCMMAISEIINSKNELINDEEKIKEVDDFVDSCFLPFEKVPNLKALVGSQLGYKDIENIKSVYFDYLIDSIVDDYDVIIVDTNSSLAHTTTFNLLSKANTCFYVLNLDFNNVRNNIRYKDMLKEIQIDHKVKYILNEDVTNSLTDEKEDLLFKSSYLDDYEFDLVAKVPMIPKTVFLNRLYSGEPIVLDNKDYTLKAKNELLKVANSIYPIEGFDDSTNITEDKSKRHFSFK